MWERSLDLIVAVCIATLIYFLVQFVEVVEATAFRGSEDSRSTSKACTKLKGDQPDYLEELCIIRSLK